MSSAGKDTANGRKYKAGLWRWVEMHGWTVGMGGNTRLERIFGYCYAEIAAPTLPLAVLSVCAGAFHRGDDPGVAIRRFFFAAGAQKRRGPHLPHLPLVGYYLADADRDPERTGF